MLEKIALQKKLITRAQCDEALAACRGADNLEIALKKYFISKNILSLNQMRILAVTYHALKIMKKNDLFGRIAVKLGYIGSELFDQEMACQMEAVKKQMPPRFIGEVWVEKKILSRNDFKRIFQASKRPPQSVPGNSPVPPPSSQDTEPSVSPPPSSPEPDAAAGNSEDLSLKAELTGGILLEVDKEGMSAFLKKTEHFDPSITPEDLKKQLMDQGILYGIAEDERINGFIRSRGYKRIPFEIASGISPRQGNDARIEYYFDTDYLKSGGKDENGNMDFKDRGEIPWVAEGSLLAEKFPMTESRNGTTVFGQVEIVSPAMDLPLKFKSGVTLSEDGLKLYAGISGHPRLGMSGNIEVASTFTVKTDINYKTGHLEYGGDIDVKGTLMDGFRIKGQAVRIHTVDGGEIHAQGDVTVDNGVNGAKIYARGNVSAKFIQNSQIYCMGNLSVAKEIVNCHIETSGAVLIPGGEVISSQIICNKGLFARNLGTDKSVPNTITAGVDTFTKKEIDTIEHRIVTCKDRLDQIRAKTKTLTLEIKELHMASSRIPIESDRAREAKLVLMQQAQELKENGQSQAMEPAGLADLNARIRDAGALVQRLDRDLNTLFNRMEHKENQILDLAVEREQVEDTLEDLFYEQANFSEWAQENPGSPVVSVTGRVSTGTVINGLGATRHITEEIKNVTIKAVALKDKKGSEIQIHGNT